MVREQFLGFGDNEITSQNEFQMKILAIDTAHGACSVAICDSGVIIGSHTDPEQSKQAERLLPIINQLLLDNNLSYADINAVAADIGPGSFTGVRIGLAAAHGIAMAAQIPLIGVSALEALEFKARTDNLLESLLVTLDARRGQVFAQVFHKNESDEPMMLDYNDIHTISSNHHHLTIIGDGVPLIEPVLQKRGINYSVLEDFTIPDASMIALCATDKFKSGNFSTNPAPLYIRPPDAKLPGGITPNLSPELL